MGALREPELLKLEVRPPQNMVLYSKSATTWLSNLCYNCIGKYTRKQTFRECCQSLSSFKIVISHTKICYNFRDAKMWCQILGTYFQLFLAMPDIGYPLWSDFSFHRRDFHSSIFHRYAVNLRGTAFVFQCCRVAFLYIGEAIFYRMRDCDKWVCMRLKKAPTDMNAAKHHNK